jgi:polyisoprenoid-binding protein YceI
MRKTLLSLALSLATIFTFATNPHIDNVRVNSESSSVKWTGSKIASSHEGNVSVAKGSLSINHGTLVGGEIAINMNSITCTDIESESLSKKLVGHLKDEDFFNSKAFPLAFIKITKAVKNEGSNYTIVADLTIKGITNSIKFEADVNIKGVEFLAKSKIKIDRTLWDIKYGSGSFFKNLGDKMILDDIALDIVLKSVN